MPFLQPDKRYTFLWDWKSHRPGCVLLQAIYGGDRDVCFAFGGEWELAPTKTMVKVTATGRQIQELIAELIARLTFINEDAVEPFVRILVTPLSTALTQRALTFERMKKSL